MLKPDKNGSLSVYVKQDYKNNIEKKNAHKHIMLNRPSRNTILSLLPAGERVKTEYRNRKASRSRSRIVSLLRQRYPTIFQELKTQAETDCEIIRDFREYNRKARKEELIKEDLSLE